MQQNDVISQLSTVDNQLELLSDLDTASDWAILAGTFLISRRRVQLQRSSVYLINVRALFCVINSAS